MTQQIIGKCSLCGGRVILETVQWVAGPPMPARCERCGAYEDQTANMPTVPMRPSGCQNTRRGSAGEPMPWLGETICRWKP